MPDNDYIGDVMPDLYANAPHYGLCPDCHVMHPIAESAPVVGYENCIPYDLLCPRLGIRSMYVYIGDVMPAN
jgi:hypothetical protein